MIRNTVHRFKVCCCCGNIARPRKRVCLTCGVPALWRAPTHAEIVKVEEQRNATEKLLLEFDTKINGNL